jgi:uncharacterized iron-regulated membrane protein
MVIDFLVKLLRKFRSIHKLIGVSISLFILVTALTGILLGWKKNADILQPQTFKGVSSDIAQWQSFQAISRAAVHAMDSLHHSGNVVDRRDVRPDNGIIKVMFKKGYWEVQVDGVSARVLSVAQRHSDWIEHLHDGSLVSDFFKLIYTNVLGIGLLTLAVSGVWLWYGPRVIRRKKQG